MVKRTKKLDLIDTLTKIKEYLPLLPGEDERQRMAQIIPEIKQELELLRESIGRFPDESETRQVSNAIQTLVSFFDTLKDKPLLAEMLLPKKVKPRKTKSSIVDVDTLQKQLERLPTEKILEELTKHKKDCLPPQLLPIPALPTARPEGQSGSARSQTTGLWSKKTRSVTGARPGVTPAIQQVPGRESVITWSMLRRSA